MKRCRHRSPLPSFSPLCRLLLVAASLPITARSYTVVTGRGLGLEVARALCGSQSLSEAGALPVVLGTRHPADTARDIERSWPQGAAWLGKGTGRDTDSSSGVRGADAERLLIIEELDVSCPASIDAFASRLRRTFAGVPAAALVNNAAICPEGSDAAALRSALNTNVRGALRLTEQLGFDRACDLSDLRSGGVRVEERARGRGFIIAGFFLADRSLAQQRSALIWGRGA